MKQTSKGNMCTVFDPEVEPAEVRGSGGGRSKAR